MARTAQAPDRLADLPEICSVADILAVFPVSRATLYRMAEQGVTVAEWLDRWLESYARPTVKLSTYSATSSTSAPTSNRSSVGCA